MGLRRENSQRQGYRKTCEHFSHANKSWFIVLISMSDFLWLYISILVCVTEKVVQYYKNRSQAYISDI